MNRNLRTEFDEYIKKEKTIRDYISSIPSQFEYQELYDAACEMAKCNTENALMVMIQIIKHNPVPMDEAIRDSILLWIQNEGNQNTYTYLNEQLKSENNQDIVACMNAMANSIVWKYEQIGIELTP